MKTNISANIEIETAIKLEENCKLKNISKSKLIEIAIKQYLED